MALYRTNFRLTAEVNNLRDAQDFLAGDDMRQYLPHNLFKVVRRIEWKLIDTDKGYIEAETTRDLTEQESEQLSGWIVGQNADGMGEVFEQEPFADYTVQENQYDDDGYWVRASFDWHTNNYELTKID